MWLGNFMFNLVAICGVPLKLCHWDRYLACGNWKCSPGTTMPCAAKSLVSVNSVSFIEVAAGKAGPASAVPKNKS